MATRCINLIFTIMGSLRLLDPTHRRGRQPRQRLRNSMREVVAPLACREQVRHSASECSSARPHDSSTAIESLTTYAAKQTPIQLSRLDIIGLLPTQHQGRDSTITNDVACAIRSASNQFCSYYSTARFYITISQRHISRCRISKSSSSSEI